MGKHGINPKAPITSQGNYTLLYLKSGNDLKSRSTMLIKSLTRGPVLNMAALMRPPPVKKPRVHACSYYIDN